MAEYIEREKVYNMLNSLGGCGADPDTWADGWDKAFDEAIRELDNIPAADVCPMVHGHWVPAANTWTHDLNEASRRIFRCSVCGRYENTKEPFCNCGAVMDEGENDG